MKKMNLLWLIFLFGLTGFAHASGEIHKASVPPAKQTIANKYLRAIDAERIKNTTGSNTLFVDVRTPAELVFVGVADLIDINIPFNLNTFSAWDEKKNSYAASQNSSFLIKMEEALEKAALNKESNIILMCRSGDRSAAAANLMYKAGYKNVYSVVDGFEGDLAKLGENAGKRKVNGWKNSDLPWTYTLTKSKMYLVE